MKCAADPIKEVRIESSAEDPRALTVTIFLAEHVASCCVNCDEAFVEVHGGGHHGRATFEFREARPGHQFVATLVVPAPGLYAYRIVANVLGHPLNREGTYDVSAKK